VCLSTLGTWRARTDEQWSPAHTLSSTLISIQSLMGSDPYSNEPGFERTGRKSDEYDKASLLYSRKITHETIRITICKRLEDALGIEIPRSFSSKKPRLNGNAPPTPSTSADDYPNAFDTSEALSFNHLTKSIFLMYYHRYKAIIKRESKLVKDGTSFTLTRFECSSNGMSGLYNYKSLNERLDVIRRTLDAETLKWAKSGLEEVKAQTNVANRLRVNYLQTKSEMAKTHPHVDIMLEAGNPFCWIIGIMGSPDTPYEGGAWQVSLRFSPAFPDEPPRAKFTTPIFHVNITPDGIPWLIGINDNPGAYCKAIIDGLANTSSDPTMVLNEEAAKLAFGGQAQKREYRRRVRACVDGTMEA